MKSFLVLLTISYISSVRAGEKIDIIGTIIYSKNLNTFNVSYIREDKVLSHLIQVKNKSELIRLKSFIGKSARIEGDLNWITPTQENFILKEELTIKKISNFELKSLALNTEIASLQDKMISHEKAFQPYQFSTTIRVSDKTANSMIAASAVALSVAGGPIIMAPAAAFGITQLVAE